MTWICDNNKKKKREKQSFKLDSGMMNLTWQLLLTQFQIMLEGVVHDIIYEEFRMVTFT